MKWQIISTDVLVIGGGTAAMRAALEAHHAGVNVLIVSKGPVGQSGASWHTAAEVGAFNVPDGRFDPEDNPEVFYNDIMNAAQGAADPVAVRVLAEESIMSWRYLKHLGVPFSKTDTGVYKGYRACFSSRPRSYMIEDHFRPVCDALLRAVKNESIPIIDNVAISDLIISDSMCYGAFAYISEYEGLEIHAGSVILATGGISTLFRHNMYPADITGDGHAMAYRSGAAMANMEFIQAGLGTIWPAINILGVQLWEAHPILLDYQHRPLLPRYLPHGLQTRTVTQEKSLHFPFSVSDLSKYIELSVHQEISKGNISPHGGVYLDFSSSDIKNLLENPHSQLGSMWHLTYSRFLSMGVDLLKEPAEIACFAHAVNGGVLVDKDGASSIPGLYAIGEAAASCHGADRLGGNMSIACQVFGRRSGIAAAHFASKLRSMPDFTVIRHAQEEKCSTLRITSNRRIDLQHCLQKYADKYLLISRNQNGLETFIHSIRQLTSDAFDSPQENGSLHDGLEFNNLLTCGEIIARAIMQRKESRGSHYREDYPDIDPSYSRMLPFSINNIS